jgi:hypothetical protein
MGDKLKNIEKTTTLILKTNAICISKLLQFKEKEGWVFTSPINPGQRISDAKR